MVNINDNIEKISKVLENVDKTLENITLVPEETEQNN